MRNLILALCGGLAPLAAPAVVMAQPFEGARWAARQPRDMWVIDVLPGPRSPGCSPEICQAGLNIRPILIGIRYTNSAAGRRVQMTASVRKCRSAFERSMTLDESERPTWQARYERLFDEMMSAVRVSCAAAVPSPLTPVELRKLILGDE